MTRLHALHSPASLHLELIIKLCFLSKVKHLLHGSSTSNCTGLHNDENVGHISML